MSNTLSYLKHANDCHNDPWMRSMIRDNGRGFAWLWWTLLEIIHKRGHKDILSIDERDLASEMMIKTPLLLDFLSVLVSKNDGKTKFTYTRVEHLLCIEASGFRDFQHNFPSKCESNAGQMLAKCPPSRVEESRVDKSARATRDNNIGAPSGQSPDLNPYTGKHDPAPIGPGTKQPIPWDPYNSQCGIYPIPFIPGYWIRRAHRAINELASKHQPMSHQERDALIERAGIRDETSERDENGRNQAAQLEPQKPDPLWDKPKSGKQPAQA